MDPAWWALNAAYAAYVVSPVFKDMLRLRFMALIVTVLFMTYGFISGIYSIVWWNIAFGAMHLFQIALLMRERMGVSLSKEDDQIRKKLFPTLDPVEFNALWSMGTERTLGPNEVIVEAGAHVVDMHLILDGAADVDVGEGRLIRLRPLALVGEMSLVSGNVACATVRSAGPTTVRSFNHAALLALGETRPLVKDAALILIGRQLAEKIHADPSLVPA